MAYSYNGILFSHRKDRSTDAMYNVAEPLKHAKQKKPVTEDCTLYNLYEMFRINKL